MMLIAYAASGQEFAAQAECAAVDVTCQLRIGDVLPVTPRRALFTDGPPAWFILQVKSQGEMPATAWLERNGAECWHPTETKFRRDKRKPDKRMPYQSPIAPGYLFALMPGAPDWPELITRSRGKVRKVVSRNGVPVPISEAVMLDMHSVPERLKAIRDAQRRAQMILPGDRASVTIGGVEWQVDVASLTGTIARFVIPLLGGREVEADVNMLRKIGGGA